MKKKFKVSDNVNGKDKNVCVKEIKQEIKQETKHETKHEEDIHAEVEETIQPGEDKEGKINYTNLTNFSTKYLVMCKVYTDVGGIKCSGESRTPLRQIYFIFMENFQKKSGKNSNFQVKLTNVFEPPIKKFGSSPENSYTFFSTCT